MREVVTRTVRTGRWAGLMVVAQGLVLASWAPRLAGEERGLAVLMICVSSLLIVVAVVLVLVDLRATLVLTEDALLLERRWRPLRIDRAAVWAVDGNIHGRPSWSEAVVLTVDGRDRPVRLGNFDVPARVLIPRLQEWAGVGDTVPASEDSASPT
ncbi:hypothetical protein [Cellulomonas sp. IC4_254]|uniref:hypothetical protein n=1 Tax=Cellulomonas sp. IC4_254 TaxID=2714040 RepID=UPI0014207DA8|nr:hypothetical protein [Cellulomonas sp. IC4_254]NHT19708.1 hypothetical protein [Cellulomonas sp. IC4_254]